MKRLFVKSVDFIAFLGTTFIFDLLGRGLDKLDKIYKENCDRGLLIKELELITKNTEWRVDTSYSDRVHVYPPKDYYDRIPDLEKFIFGIENNDPDSPLKNALDYIKEEMYTGIDIKDGDKYDRVNTKH